MTSTALEFLQELRARGVTARVRGENLSLRPREALDVELLERARALKGEILGLLEAEPVSLDADSLLGQPDSWPEDSIAQCRRRLLDAGDLILEFARARWGGNADAWPVEILAGLFVRDVLAGLHAALGPWRGWKALRQRLDHQTGPTAITRVWMAYAGLDEEMLASLLRQHDGTPGLSRSADEEVAHA